MTVPFNKSSKCFCFWILLLLVPSAVINVVKAAQEVEEEDFCDLHDLSDEALFQRAFNRTLGDCIIHLGSRTSFCDFYVEGKPRDSSGSSTGYKGIPLTSSGSGSGCVSSLCPQCSADCWYDDPSYPLTANERASMCTTSIVKNAAAQIRYGIRNGFCSNQVCSSITTNPTPAPSTAPTSGTANIDETVQWEDIEEPGVREETEELAAQVLGSDQPQAVDSVFRISKIAANADCTRILVFLRDDFLRESKPRNRDQELATK